MAKRKLVDYYRQFEALSPEEDSQRMRAKRAEERSRELALVPDLDLSQTAWHEPPDPDIVNVATFSLRRAINRYPEAGGGAAARAVAGRHGLPVERVALGHGAGQLLQAALREHAGGGEVLVPWPSWSPLPALATRAGVRPVLVPLAGERPDLAALGAAVGESTRAVVICSPNDPTGALTPPEDVRAFAGSLPPQVSVLLDEALIELAGEQASAAPLLDEVPNLVVFRSFSKAWAMAGLRAGYALGSAADEELLAALTPGSGVSSPAQAAIAGAFEDPARADARLARQRREIAEERDRLAAALEGTAFSFVPSAANFVWLRGRDMTAASLTHGLAGQGVIVASGADWGDDDHVRVSVRDRRATERLSAALRALAR